LCHKVKKNKFCGTAVDNARIFDSPLHANVIETKEKIWIGRVRIDVSAPSFRRPALCRQGEYSPEDVGREIGINPVGREGSCSSVPSSSNVSSNVDAPAAAWKSAMCKAAMWSFVVRKSADMRQAVTEVGVMPERRTV
jgi:hypothetical protein